jgi:hypothetical protein
VLAIEQVPFEMVDGNCQGYARKRSVAVSPIAENPVKTMLHELAHVVLGHTEAAECSDSGELTRAEREVEAEGCAYICGNVLGITGLEKSRGYLQSWLGAGSVPERSATRIFKAADAILKAGRPADGVVNCSLSPARFWWLNDHHDGQWSRRYARLCKLARSYRPGPLECGPTDSESQAIYDNLCDREGCGHARQGATSD